MSHMSDETFEMICRMLIGERRCRNHGVKFKDFCHASGVERVSLENMLYEVFGMSGDDIISTLCTGKLHIAD